MAIWVYPPDRLVRYPSATSCWYASTTTPRETPRLAAIVRVGGNELPCGSRPERIPSRIDASICWCNGTAPSRRSSTSSSAARLELVLGAAIGSDLIPGTDSCQARRHDHNDAPHPGPARRRAAHAGRRGLRRGTHRMERDGRPPAADDRPLRERARRGDGGSHRARARPGDRDALRRAQRARPGLATTAGNVSHTGVGGLTLGGGMGWLARQHGLACDNVLSFELVTADGEVVRASRTEHPDLFWGLRGGGGNFGVVTEFEFRLHPVGTRTLVAEYAFPLEEALPVLRGWRDLNAQAPRQATFTASVGAEDRVTVGFVWVGDPEAGRRLLPAMRALGRPLAERVYEPSYLELQSRDDTVGRHALRRYSKGHYLGELPDAAIEAFLARGCAGGRHPSLPNAGLQAYGGAIADVSDRDSAFSHRNALFEFGTGLRWTDPAEDQARMEVARRAAAALEP